MFGIRGVTLTDNQQIRSIATNPVVANRIQFNDHRPWVMGILNVTPDSFSDGGRWGTTEAAIERGHALVAQGCDLVDVGGESTRPGAHRVSAAEELSRVLPVIKALAADGIGCSVDTTRAEVAAAAVAAGASIINDVSGGLADPHMVHVAADTGVPWILMHWRGHSEQMQQLASYTDVTADVIAELSRQVDRALQAGVAEHALILDPGLGFAKNPDHDLQLLRDLPKLVQLRFPVLVGASRKKFIGQTLADCQGNPRPPALREVATAAVSLLSCQMGAWGVRVHEPTPSLDVFAIWQAINNAGQQHDRPGLLLPGPDLAGERVDG